MSDKHTPQTRPWRTLVRVLAVDEVRENVTLVLPSWNHEQPITLPMADLPEEIRWYAAPNYRCHVTANVGAEDVADLVLRDWEFSPVEDQQDDYVQPQDVHVGGGLIINPSGWSVREDTPLAVGNLRGVRIEGQEEVYEATRARLRAEHEEFMRKVRAGEVELPLLTEDRHE